MKAIPDYAAILKKVKALEAILKDLKPRVLKELEREPEGKTCVAGVSFHLTQVGNEWEYAKKIKAVLDDLKQQMETVKMDAQASGEMTRCYHKSFDAEIPKAEQETIFQQIMEYQEYFG